MILEVNANMKKTTILTLISLIIISVGAMRNSPAKDDKTTQTDDTTKGKKVKVMKTDAEWKAILTPEQYQVTRQHGTERAFTGALYDNHEPGIYYCVCCGQE